MRLLFIAIFYSIFLLKTFGQSVVAPHFLKIKPVRESIILGSGLYFSIHGKILENHLDGLTAMKLDEILSNPPQKLDFAERHYSSSARKWSSLLLAPAYGTAAALCFTQIKSRRDLFENSLVLAETGLLTYGTTLFTKVNAKKLRPFVYNEKAPISKKLVPDARESFFSGHTSTTAAMSFFSAKIWAIHHPGSRLAPWIWSAAAAYPAVVGLLRMEGGMHHFRDVATGYLVGAAIGYGVPALHEKRSKKRATTPIY